MLPSSVIRHPRYRIAPRENLSRVVNWYVEKELLYIRVFGAFIPLHALPLLIPDRLACREITRQTVIGGISKELKGYSKKVWPPFPIHLDTYSLLDFEHAKAKEAALEDINLIHIKFKKHDPHRIMSNHLASCGLKRFEHENSPHDDIFRGMKSYDEVLARIEALSPKERADVFRFQEHRWSCLPPVLQGENPMTVEVKKIKAEGSKGSVPNQEGQQDKEEQARGLKPEAEASSPPSESTSIITPRKSSKQVENPITSITPLQSAKKIPDVGWISGEKLTPIAVEELPSNELFFDKKRKVVVRQELY
jgi:hypothetical protein